MLKIAGERKNFFEVAGIGDLNANALNEKERDRLLGRFKNSFANLALPMLASTQPVPAETFELPLQMKKGSKGEKNADNDENYRSFASFTMWDVIKAPSTVNKCTLAMICAYINSRYNVNVDSLTWGDYPLYADYMIDGDDRYKLTVAEAIEAAMDDCDDEDDDGFDEDEDGFIDDRRDKDDKNSNGREKLEYHLKMANHWGYLDLDATTSTDDSLQIPPIRVYFRARTNVKKLKQNNCKGGQGSGDYDGYKEPNRREQVKKMGQGFAERLKKFKSDVQEKFTSSSISSTKKEGDGDL